MLFFEGIAVFVAAVSVELEKPRSTWRTYENGKPFSYVKFAEEMIPYLQDMGYTHLELMPLAEYPFDGSWGYQIIGYFAPTSRYGTPEDMMKMVDMFQFFQPVNGVGNKEGLYFGLAEIKHSRTPCRREWRPNKDGGNENYEAIEFLRKLNTAVFGRCGNILMIAEESTAWPLVEHISEESAQGSKFFLHAPAAHLVEQRSLSVHHLVVGNGKNIVR